MLAAERRFAKWASDETSTPTCRNLETRRHGEDAETLVLGVGGARRTGRGGRCASAPRSAHRKKAFAEAADASGCYQSRHLRAASTRDGARPPPLLTQRLYETAFATRRWPIEPSPLSSVAVGTRCRYTLHCAPPALQRDSETAVHAVSFLAWTTQLPEAAAAVPLTVGVLRVELLQPDTTAAADFSSPPSSS